jgi:lipopolysaccharide biosynthesis glycosyltransferase
VNVLFSIDASYYHQLRAVLTSLVQHHEHVELAVHVLHLDLGQVQIDTIRRDFHRPSLTLDFYKFNPPLNADELLYSTGHIQSLSTFSRVFLGDVLPETVDKILYLDCDILIRGDLTELWNEPFDGCVVIAARDVSCEVEFYTIADCPEMAGRAKDPYFNAGVLLVDVRRFRELQVKETCLDLIGRYGSKLRCYDQDVLNMALSGRWKQMSWRWNYLAPLAFVGNSALHRSVALPAQYADPRLVHFIYQFKPWQSAYLGPYREEFLRHFGGQVEPDTSPMLWRRLCWDLYEFSTSVHYFKLSTRRFGLDLGQALKLLAPFVRKPWVPAIFPFFAVYQRHKRGF